MNADIDQEGSRWFQWLMIPGILTVFFMAGIESPRTPEIPFTAFMLLGLLSFMTLPLGALSPAFPVSRAGWFWSRVVRQALLVAGASLMWALGLATCFLLSRRVPPGWEGVLWSLALFLAAALGPFMTTITSQPRARPNQPFPIVSTVTYLALTFTPWSLCGTAVSQMPWPIKAGLAMFLLVGVGVCWAVGLFTFRRRDWRVGL